MPFRTPLRISRAAMRKQSPATARSLSRALGEMPGPESQPILINAGRERRNGPPFQSFRRRDTVRTRETRYWKFSNRAVQFGMIFPGTQVSSARGDSRHGFRCSPSWLGAAFTAASVVGALAAAEAARAITPKIKFLFVNLAARVLLFRESFLLSRRKLNSQAANLTGFAAKLPLAASTRTLP
jgi:hypothetical protein